MHEVMAKSILSQQNGMNIYRGCSHGCIYCDARSTCYQMKHDFEDIEVKINAPALLERALKSKKKKCMIGTGAMSDPYIPLEMDLGLTRQCLELIDYYGFGLAIQTKSDRILRDLDLLKSINTKAKCVVQMTLTTYDEELCKKLEPAVCTTKRRAEVLNIMRDEGIPTVVWMSPILPFINDTRENIEGLLSYCNLAKVKGILQFGMGLTLRDGDRQYYYQQLERFLPGMVERYVRTYQEQYELPSPNEKELMDLLIGECKKNQMMYRARDIFEYMHRYESKMDGQQLSLFDV